MTGFDGIFAGFELTVPRAALAVPTQLIAQEAIDTNPLPDGGVALGTQFRLLPADLTLAKPLTVTVPYLKEILAAEGGDPLAVKVWYVGPQGWTLLEPSSKGDGEVTFEIDIATAFGAGLFDG